MKQCGLQKGKIMTFSLAKTTAETLTVKGEKYLTFS